MDDIDEIKNQTNDPWKEEYEKLYNNADLLSKRMNKVTAIKLVVKDYFERQDVEVGFDWSYSYHNLTISLTDKTTKRKCSMSVDVDRSERVGNWNHYINILIDKLQALLTTTVTYTTE